MVQLCPQIGCSGVLHVEADDFGRVLRCKKCGSPLRVEERGLVLLSAPTPPPLREDHPDRPMPRAEPVRETRDKQETASMPHDPRARGDILTALFAWLFTVGMLTILVFFFLPRLDQTSILAQEARIKEGEREQSRLDDKLFGRGRFETKEKPEPSEDAIKSRATQREEWDKRRRALEEDVESSRLAAPGRGHLYNWGMFAGFVILALASVGFLTRGPSTARRVVGAVALVAQLLLIFASALRLPLY